MEPKTFIVTEGASPRKVVGKSKGSAQHYDDGSFSYTPYNGTGESSRTEEVRGSDGNSCTYLTKGKKPYRMVQLKCLADDPALCHNLQAQLDEFVAGFGKPQFESPKKKPRKAVDILWDTQQMKVALVPKEGCAVIEMRIPLGTAEDMKKQAFYNFQNINQCFTTKKSNLLHAYRAQKKTSSESSTTGTSAQ